MSDNPLGFCGNAAANTVEVGDKVRTIADVQPGDYVRWVDPTINDGDCLVKVVLPGLELHPEWGPEISIQGPGYVTHHYVNHSDGSPRFELVEKETETKTMTVGPTAESILAYITDPNRNLSAAQKMDAIAQLKWTGVLVNPRSALTQYLDANPDGLCLEGIERARKHFGLVPDEVEATVKFTREEAEVIVSLWSPENPDSRYASDRATAKVVKAVKKALEQEKK